MDISFPCSPRKRARLFGRSACVLALLWGFGTAHADFQDISVSPCTPVDTSFAATPGQAIPANTTIKALNSSGTVYWAFASSGATPCTGGPTVFTCAGTTVTVPPPDTPTSANVTITGTAGALGQKAEFTLTATDVANPSKTCDGIYFLHVTSTGGGWGDPHLTTVDGIHYDFQSAGEFIALRDEAFEVQARQAPVQTASVPGPNEYTGLASCVSIYTAVAARIGSNRLSYQPIPGGNAMQLRVNGRAVALTATPIDLFVALGRSAIAQPKLELALPGRPPIIRPPVLRPRRTEGRIEKTATGFQVTDRRGTRLVVTQDFWAAQNLFYLNIDVQHTSAIRGTIGALAAGSWLPALADGSSLGPKPASAQQRYDQLYVRFADSWRVSAGSSLFDYAPGTSTQTFTRHDWPLFQPQSCAPSGQAAARPASVAVAQQACSAVGDPVKRADCIFDVSVSGHTGFANAYRLSERVRPRVTGWQVPVSKLPRVDLEERISPVLTPRVTPQLTPRVTQPVR